MGHEMLLLLHKLRFRKSTVGCDGDWRGEGALHTASPLYSLDTVQQFIIHSASSLPLLIRIKLLEKVVIKTAQ